MEEFGIAPSAVQDAGNGLYLRRRDFDIPAGRYVCEYTTVWHPSRAIGGLQGSRDYLVDVDNIVYDGELFTGVNFGR